MVDRKPGWLERATAKFKAQAPLAGAHGAVVNGSSNGIHVRTEREELPRFRRIYSAHVSKGRTVKVTAQTLFGRRSMNGELTQPDGKWVLFDPDRIADKILDPALVPEVEAACRSISAVDRAFMLAVPRSFVDEAGTTWVRQP